MKVIYKLVKANSKNQFVDVALGLFPHSFAIAIGVGDLLETAGFYRLCDVLLRNIEIESCSDRGSVLGVEAASCHTNVLDKVFYLSNGRSGRDLSDEAGQLLLLQVACNLSCNDDRISLSGDIDTVNERKGADEPSSRVATLCIRMPHPRRRGHLGLCR